MSKELRALGKACKWRPVGWGLNQPVNPAPQTKNSQTSKEAEGPANFVQTYILLNLTVVYELALHITSVWVKGNPEVVDLASEGQRIP